MTDAFWGALASVFFAPFLAVSALIAAAHLAVILIDLVVKVFSPDEVDRLQ